MRQTETRSIFVRWVINALALYAAVSVVPGLRFDEGPGRFMIVAALFGLVNSLLRPILTVLTCPLVLVTLGLFTLVINAVLLLLTGWLSDQWGLGFKVAGFWPAFWGGLLIGVVSVILSLLVGERPVTVVRHDIE